MTATFLAFFQGQSLRSPPALGSTADSFSAFKEKTYHSTSL
jgi:hypothetical protein